MSKRLSTVWAVVFVCFMFGGSAWAMNAIPVSPLGEEGVAVIGQNCPQFSWSYVEGAIGYEIVVFEGEEGLSYEEKSSLSEALIEKVIPSPGLTWAPEGGGCLKSGKGYVWYVRAVEARGPGVWSEGARFRVDDRAMVEALREPVQEVVREYFSSEQVVKERLVGLEVKIREEVKRELEGESFIGVGSTPKVLGVEGPNNTFYGQGAGATITSSVGNSFFGVNAGNKTTTGYLNTFLGYYAGFSNTTGNVNTFLGNAAGFYNTTGNSNTFLGYDAGYSNTTGGANAFLGLNAGYSNTTGYNNTFLGYDAGYSNTTGNSNTLLGYNAGGSNTTGNSNTLLGNLAGYSNTTGAGNVFLGNRVGYNETGSNKLYIDNSNTPTPLIYGEFDNNIVTINGKLGIGTTTPQQKIDVGGGAITLNGADNTGGVTPPILRSLTSDAGRIDFGYGGRGGGNLEAYSKAPTNYSSPADDRRGQFRFIYGGDTTLGEVRYVHYDGTTWATKMWLTYDGQLHMSGGAYTDGHSWINSSSRAYKENIRGLSVDEAMDTLRELSPVKFNYKADSKDTHVGFIAEDVPALVATRDRKGMSPMDVVAVLTKVVQDQQKTIAELSEKLNDLESNLRLNVVPAPASIELLK